MIKQITGILLLLLILAGCGGLSGLSTAGEDAPGTDAELPRLDEAGDLNSQVPIGGTVTSRPTVEIETETAVETDSSGIPVGFTEDGRPYKGNPNAPIVIEEFSDFQCPFCSRFATETLPQLEEQYIANGEVLLIYYDFPLDNIHPQARAASLAARCVGEQSAAGYWAMHDWLLVNIQSWSVRNPAPVFLSFVQTLDIDSEQFQTCYENETYADAIQADVDLARQRGVGSTPSFFINDQPFIGAQPMSNFSEAIAIINSGGQFAEVEPTAPPRMAPTPASIPIESVAMAYGDPDAPVTIIEYTDFECPFCARHVAQTKPAILNEMVANGRVYYVMKDFPLDDIHPDARRAANAARCAGEQGFYPEMHDALFANQSQWSGLGEAANDYFTRIAEELGMDTLSFNECAVSFRYADAIQADWQEGLSLGVNGTPAFFINGYPVSGAQPYELFEYAVELAEAGILDQAYTENAPPPRATPRPAAPATISEGDAFVLGDPDAPITIVEYTDFQCPFCSRHATQTFPLLVENYIETGVVRYVFKDLPLTSIHPQAIAAAEAARCARDQEAFLEMHEVLFAQQQAWSGRSDPTSIFVGFADDLGLDTATFQSCLDNNVHEAAVLADLQEGQALGISGTPAFFFNGYFLSGAQPYEVFEQAIAQLLEDGAGDE